MPYQLIDAADGRVFGTLTEQQLQDLAGALDENSLDDRDYNINLDTLDMLVAQGTDGGLLELLRSALGDREEMDVRWQEI